jgi:hypothetical protein
MKLLRTLAIWFGLIALLAGIIPASVAAQPTGSTPICFPDIPEVDACIDSAFAGYWQSNGGLPVFGYPLAGLEQYTPPDADTPLTVQWLERNRLELHPQNPPEYRVLLGRMGAERLAQLGRDPAQEPRDAGPQPGCLWFETTGQNVCDQAPGVGFKSYWETNGLRIPGLNAYQRSLALFGLPLTPAQPEPGPDGELILTQWFERARFEWHPDNSDPFRVLLGRLGSEVRPNVGAVEGIDLTDAGLPRIGVEMTRRQVGSSYEQISAVGAGWVRYNGITWFEVEQTRGRLRWNRTAIAEEELRLISAQGAAPMVVIRGAPGWAQAVSGKTCGPFKPEVLPEFAAFVSEVVKRYSVPPYNVKHWELGNEPDAPFRVVDGNAGYGCWGDPSLPDAGGAAYAAMLRAAYPAIKAADPEAKVVLGGLLLDCDPDRDGAACPTGRFLDGVLAAGGGDYFDIIAYHSYTYWGPVQADWDLNVPKWSHRGGVLRGKLDFIRQELARYGLVKPIVMNEGGLLCFRADPSCGPRGFYADQANYAVRLLSRSVAEGLAGVAWYTLNGPGWQDGGLLDAQQQPRPAFNAYRFMTGFLREATYIGPLGNGALEGYAFRSGDQVYRVYWTNDTSRVSVDLPANATVYTSEGTQTAVAGSTILVGFEPLIVVSPQ